MKKVFVSGCYDMLHSGHVAFFEEASGHGDLYVGIGSDRTIMELKARLPINTDRERLYMVKSLRYVRDAWINGGSGVLDFRREIELLRPDIFFVNTDGHSPLKERLCAELGIEYVVSHRIPMKGLPARSTTSLRSECRIPYRIDIAGGWLDQPFVSRHHAGSVLTISIEPDYEFNDRSGMSTSSRKKAIELWQTDIPEGNRAKLARTLFCYENPPGTSYISGSQDSLGIVYPGLNRLYYDGDYWPSSIESILDESVLRWLESHLWLLPLYPRPSSYDVLSDTSVTLESVKGLSEASELCWRSILSKDLLSCGRGMSSSFDYQLKMFPNMATSEILDILEGYKSKVSGWKLSGAGGGGYFIFLSEFPVANGLQIRIRRG